ncbi:MAG TPA: AMP-binding protein, partial [Burkholderiaceae bacterium]|nr:AMP-binding protein [Burkholderiaceae bacterium]
MDQKQPHPADCEPIETARLEELRVLQLQRMQWSLKHAYENVPRYRTKFDQAGVHPRQLKELSDLAKFPFTTKADLRETYPYGMFAVPMRDIVRVHASSGTTGRPTVVGYTRNDIAMWASVMARSLRAAGVTSEDILLNSYGYGLFTGGLGLHYGGEALGATVIPMSGGQTEKQVQMIRELHPTVLLCTPSYSLTIADELMRQGVKAGETSLRVGLFGAEPWTNEMRREIETRLGIDAVDVYGLSEVIGPGVACEFVQTKDGPHIWEDHFYPEIIDPDTGKVLP